VSSGRTSEPGEDVVAVAVGRLAYGSAASSLLWYGWLASTGLARWRHRTGQTDRQDFCAKRWIGITFPHFSKSSKTLRLWWNFLRKWISVGFEKKCRIPAGAGFRYSHSRTHTHTQPFYSSLDFVRDNQGEPVPEETFTHSHLSWSSIISYLLPPSIMIHGILSFNLRASLSLSLSLSLSPSFLLSTSWPGTLHFILHTFLHPVIVFFSQHMPIPSQLGLLYYWNYVI